MDVSTSLPPSGYTMFGLWEDDTFGATREIGSALTRLCMRHRSIENKLKAFTGSIVDALVNPLQDKIEDWKKVVIQLDKDHAKEYKKARQEIKRASTDMIRLQKKVKKGKCDLQSRLNSAVQEFNGKMHLLEDAERDSVRRALIEERSRFCMLVSCLKPVVDEEISMLADIGHLQEIINSLCLHAVDPHKLPAASEQVILDTKGNDASTWSFQSPPSSPSSLGSRKSSMCSMASANSSSDSSVQSHVSPAHHYRHSAPAQQLMPGGAMRLSSVSSQDSGFTSQDTLFLKPTTPLQFDRKSSLHEGSSSSSTDGSVVTPTSPHFSSTSTSASTWSNWPEPPRAPPEAQPVERPHTISTAYEGRVTAARPHLTSHTFQPPEAIRTAPTTPYDGVGDAVAKGRARPIALPTVPNFNMANTDQVLPQPTYVNPDELATPKQDEVTGCIGGDTGLVELRRKHNYNAIQPDRSALSRVIEELNNSTTALRRIPNEVRPHRLVLTPTGEQEGGHGDLEQAIRDLDASTAALEQMDSSSSLPSSSSGYETMSSTSEQTIHDADVRFPSFDTFPAGAFYTIPRNHVLSRSFRAPATVRRPVSAAGVLNVCNNVASVRRSATLNYQRPPPLPIRRNSSITSSLSSAAGPTSPVNDTAAPVTNFTPHRRTFSEGSMADHDLDDLPPPPPELLHDPEEISHETTAKCNPGGLVKSHANIIDCLNRKFAAHAPKTAPVLGTQLGVNRGSQGSSGEVTPTAEVNVTSGFLVQIQRGVSLRRTITNDRSKPKLP